MDIRKEGKRTVSSTRTYALKQFENLKLTDTIEFPEGLDIDPSLLDKIRTLQAVEMEIAYIRYKDIALDVVASDEREGKYLEALNKYKDDLEEEIKKFNKDLEGEK